MNMKRNMRLLALMLAVCLVALMLPVQTLAAAEFTDVGSWYETIYAEISGVKDAQVSAVSWSGKASGSLTGDALTYLVRDTDDGVRIDIPGLTPGSYTLTVKTTLGTLTQADIQVTAFDRSGFAHYNYTEGVGAYKDDGTLKSNAIVLYVTDQNKNTVSVTSKDGTKVTGIGNILNSAGAAGVSKGAANTNGGILKKLANDGTPLVVRIIGNVTAPEGLTAWGSVDYGGGTDDNGSLARMQDCRNITIEGIGNNATCNGWGFSIDCKTGNYSAGLGRNFEFRNITFKNVPEDCIGLAGKQANGVLSDPIERCWTHHCAFYGPSGLKDASADQDKDQGDGAFDFKRGQYCTLSYCYFEGYHKTSLVGGGDSDMQYHITWHHNYWKNCESRGPLGRQANMHIYNNVIEGQSSYCMSLRANLYIFSEYNSYINSKKVTDGVAGGVCKSYNNIFKNCTGTSNRDLVIVTDKSTQVTSANKYANFDTNASLSYIPSGDYLLQTDSDAVYETVTAMAGPQKGEVEEQLPVVPDVNVGSKIHNFTESKLSSDFYTFTSCNTNNGKGTVSYNGLTMTVCLKMESATQVTFEAPTDGNLLLVFHGVGYNNVSAAGSTVKLNGKAYTVGDDNTVAIPVTAGTNTLTKGSAQIFLYYMAYVPNAADLFEIPAVSMRLGNNLGIYFYVAKADVASGSYYMGITKTYADGRTDVVKTVPKSDWLSGGDYYLVAFEGIAAKEMTDPIKAIVYTDSGVQASKVKETSVETYALNMLRDEDSTGALKTVLADMLNYGAAAQTEFGYNTAKLANAQMTAEEAAYATASLDVTALNAVTEKGTGCKGSSLSLKSSIVLNVFFDPAVVTQTMTAKISYTNHNNKTVSAQIPGSQFQALGSSYLYLNVDSLVAGDIESVVTVAVYNGDTLVSENRFNVASYCASHPDDAVVVELAKFCTSAYAYFHP